MQNFNVQLRLSSRQLSPLRNFPQKGHLEVNGSDSSTDHELRVGSPLKFRIVGVSIEDGRTKLGLVYLELPKDSEQKD